MRLHIDTDFAGDPDDACALAMVLGWPDVELVGITTTADPDGVRAGYAAHVLDLVGRTDVPIAAGAGHSLTTGERMGEIPDHERYWGAAEVVACPGPSEAAIELLGHSLGLGATVAAIGPYTNLALLEARHPGRLDDAPVVAMGGWVYPPAPGMPAWGPETDWNVQCDTRAAQTVTAHAALTLVTLPATFAASLRATQLPRLAASGRLGASLAGQSVAHGTDYRLGELACSHPGLPDDLVNFQWDPVTCAVAMGWPGVLIEEMALLTVLDGDLLRFLPAEAGRRVRVVTGVDGEDFAEIWLAAVEAAQQPNRPPR